MIERSLVILKPKAMSGGHMWEILTRSERVWLRILAGNLIHADPEIMWRHYPDHRVDRIKRLGEIGIENYEKFGMNIEEDFGTTDAHQIGTTVRRWLIEMMTSDLIFVTVWEWPHAIEIIRKLVWHTLPLLAAPGTIRGDYSYDSAYLANMEHRPIDNLIHASGDKEEAAYEISIWFPELQ